MLRLCSHQEYGDLTDGTTRVKLLEDVWQPLIADREAVRQLQRSLVIQLSPLVPHIKWK